MLTYPARLYGSWLAVTFIYIHTLSMRTMKVLASLRICAGSPPVLDHIFSPWYFLDAPKLSTDAEMHDPLNPLHFLIYVTVKLSFWKIKGIEKNVFQVSKNCHGIFICISTVNPLH